MYEQLSIEGLGPPQRAPRGDPLFFAVRPDAPAGRKLVELGEMLSSRHNLTGPAMSAERLHVSLRGCRGPRGGIDKAAAALRAAVVLDMDAFAFSLDHVMSFRAKPGLRPVAACGISGELEDLHVRLHQAMGRAGFSGPIGRSFLPHVTLLWAAAEVPAQPIAPIGWMVREVVLIHSVWGEARHRILGRWPLHG